jgi:hypothetical protein
MKWGPSQSFIDTLKRYGRPLPAEYLARPSLSMSLTFYLDAFWEIGTNRQVTVIPGAGTLEGPIPFTAIDCFAKRYKLRGDGFERFKTLMRALDGEYRTARSQAQQKQRAIEQDNEADPVAEARQKEKQRIQAAMAAKYAPAPASAEEG